MDASLQKALRKDTWGKGLLCSTQVLYNFQRWILHSLCKFGVVIWCLSSGCRWFWALYPSSIFRNWSRGYGVPLASWDFSTELTSFTSFFHWAQYLGACGEDNVLCMLVELAAVARRVISRCKNTLEWECFCWVTAVMQCTISIFTLVLSVIHPLAGIQDLGHGRHIGSLVQSSVLKDAWYQRKETSGFLVANVGFVLILLKFPSGIILSCLMRLRLD